MVAKKKKLPDKKDAGTSRLKRALRNNAEEQLARFPASGAPGGQTPEQLVHELRVHQIELETQAEELRKAKFALEESRDRFLDLYDFAPIGYLTLSDKGLIVEVNLTCATLLGVERSRLVKARFSKYIAKKDVEGWHWYFINVLNQDEKKCCTLTLIRCDGSMFPARLESIRITDRCKGTPTARVAISDISDIVRADDMLKDQHSFLKGILESTDSAIFSLDREYRYISFNTHHAQVMKQLYGADIELGRSIFDYQLVNEDRIQSKRNIDRTLAGEQVTLEAFSGEEARSRRYFEVVHHPIKDADDNVIGAAVFAQDITDRKVAEDALRTSRIQLAEAMDLAQLVNWDFDVATGIFSFDDRFYAFYGTTTEIEGGNQMPAEVYARKFVHPDDQHMVADEVNKAIQAIDPGYVSQVEHRIIRRDGEVRHIIVRFGITKDKNGRTVKTHGANQDITDLKAAEDALRFHAEIERNMSEAAYLIRVSDGKIVYANPAFERLLGHNPGELNGRHVSTVNAPTDKSAEETASGIMSGLAQTGSWAGEVLNLRKDGTTVWCHANVITFEHPRYGNVWLSMHQDITDRKRAEDAHKESEERYRRITEGLTDYLYTVCVQDGKAVSTTHGAACVAVTGYTAEEFARDPYLWIRMVFEDDRNRVISHVNEVLKGKSVPPIEHRIVRKDGQIRWVRDTPVLQLDADGMLVSYDGVIKDITAMRQAEEALQESERTYRNLYEYAQVGLFETSLRDGTVIACNERYASLAGFSSVQDAIGKDIVHLYANNGDRKEVSRILHERGHIDDHIVQFKNHLTGRPFWAQFSARINIKKDAAEGTIINISEQKRIERELAAKHEELMVSFEQLTAAEEELKGQLDALAESEQTLRLSENRLLMAQEIGQTGAWEYSFETDKIWGSAKGLHIFGFPAVAGAFPIEDIESCIPERERVHAALVDLISAGKEYNLEYAINPADGSARKVIHSVARLDKDAQGKSIRVVGVIQDITGRKATEELIRAEHELVTALASTVALKDALPLCLATALRQSGMDSGGIYLVSETTGDLELAFSSGLAEEFVQETSCVRADSDSARLVLAGRPIYSQHLQLGVPLTRARENEKLRAIAIIPILSKNRVIACFNIASHTRDTVPDESRTILESIAGLIGNGIARFMAEETTRTSEERYRALFEGAAEGILVADIATENFLYANTAICRMLGYSADELITMRLEDIHPAKDLDVVRKEFLTLARGEKNLATDIPCLKKDKTVLYAEIVTSRMMIDNRLCNVGFFLDITGRKVTEEALKAREQSYRTLAENLPGIVYRIHIRKNGRMQFFNSLLVTMTGYNEEELTEGEVCSIDPLIVAKDRDRIIAEVNAAIRDKRGFLVEYQITHKDGTLRFFIERGRPIFDNDGLLCIDGIIQDITGRKRAEETLQHLTEFQESIISNALVWLSVLDQAGKILVWNAAAAEISGYRSEEVIGRNAIWKQLYPDKEYRKQVTSTINRIIREKKHLENFETVIRTKDGADKVISWNTKGIPDVTGKTADYIVIGMDVTERHRAEEQLHKTVDELKRFNNLTVDRELRMIALKQEINALLKNAGKEEKYRMSP